MLYSVKLAQERALAAFLRQAKILAKGQDSEYKLKHPDEARDGARNDFTKLQVRIKNDFQTHLKRLEDRRNKIGERL